MLAPCGIERDVLWISLKPERGDRLLVRGWRRRRVLEQAGSGGMGWPSRTMVILLMTTGVDRLVGGVAVDARDGGDEELRWHRRTGRRWCAAVELRDRVLR